MCTMHAECVFYSFKLQRIMILNIGSKRSWWKCKWLFVGGRFAICNMSRKLTENGERSTRQSVFCRVGKMVATATAVLGLGELVNITKRCRK